MGKKLKEFKKLVKTGKIDLEMWREHFWDKKPDKCTCNDCIDYRLGACEGGDDPFECMRIDWVVEWVGWEGA